jgi:hypothetical protein
MSLDEISLNERSLDEMSLNEMSVDKMSLDEMYRGYELIQDFFRLDVCK